jgi:hypothetical protein
MLELEQSLKKWVDRGAYDAIHRCNSQGMDSTSETTTAMASLD